MPDTLPADTLPGAMAEPGPDHPDTAGEQGRDPELMAMDAIEVVGVLNALRTEMQAKTEAHNADMKRLGLLYADVEYEIMQRLRENRLKSPVMLDDQIVSVKIDKDTKWSVSDVRLLREWVKEFGYPEVLQARIAPKGLDAVLTELRDRVGTGELTEDQAVIPGISSYTREVLRTSFRSR